ncbi:MAG TPA: glycosyltransferase [Jatrophihabitans sp.]|jgi:glycosyltransferase involved in cell wall biosynthesis|uniref:glycosyltransferase n=1 Tax=Jatrophihabitans sp. TaxID=1932789 RepID=UPI002EEBBE98
MSLFQARTPAEAASLLPVNDQPVVIVPVFNSYDDVVRCYEAYFRNTPADVPLLVVDDRGWDRRPFQVLKEVFDAAAPAHDVVVLEQISNKGFLLTMNDAFVAAGRSDIVILNSDVIVGPEWLTRMREAAYSSSTVATVTALTNHGTIVSVPKRNVATDDVPGGLSVDEAARRVAAGSPRLRPRIPTAIGHCTYVKRSVLDVVGPFDPAFNPGYGEEVDFSQRALAAGFEHVVADDVFVFHKGGSSFGRSPEIEKRKYEHEQIIQRRYPYYGPWVRRSSMDDYSPLAASLLAARRSLQGLVVAVDGMCLGPLPAGTQVVVVETVRALAQRPDVHQVLVYTPLQVPDYVRDAFTGHAKIEIRQTTDLTPQVTEKAHVVYRPYQVRDADELEWLRSIGERVVVNQLDLIAYHDAAYFSRDQAWRDYRDLAKLSAYVVDGLTYLSEHSRDAARSEGLLPDDKPNRVIYCGTEHTALTPQTSIRPPGTESAETGFILCLGVSYLHKNRLFALSVLAELHKQGWRGSLVLAGAQPPDGSSLPAEARFMLEHPELAQFVVNLGMISEAEKVWLYSNAGLVLYPTISEGFGLVPFEAAHYGVPCLSTRQGSLVEVLPEDIPVIDEFEPVRAAETARALLDDPAAGQKVVDQILSKGAEFSWARVASDVLEVLHEVTSRPACRVVAIRGEQDYAYLAGAGFGNGGSGSPVKKGIDFAVDWFLARPDIRVKLVPPGSKRQALVRQGIDIAHRRL